MRKKLDNKTYLEANPSILKTSAEKALEKAKELEKQRRKNGKKYVQINPRTRVLR